MTRRRKETIVKVQMQTSRHPSFGPRERPQSQSGRTALEYSQDFTDLNLNSQRCLSFCSPSALHCQVSKIFNHNHTRIMVYNGQGEIGLVLAVKSFPKKTSPGHKFGGGH